VNSEYVRLNQVNLIYYRLFQVVRLGQVIALHIRIIQDRLG
jgi:hypothetical protein